MAHINRFQEAGEVASLLQKLNAYAASGVWVDGIGADPDSTGVLSELVRELGLFLDAVAGSPAFDVITEAVAEGSFGTELAAIDADLTALGALIV